VSKEVEFIVNAGDFGRHLEIMHCMQITTLA